MRHRRATINESFGAWEFLYINSGCPVRGEELVHFQFYCEDFHSKAYLSCCVFPLCLRCRLCRNRPRPSRMRNPGRFIFRCHSHGPGCCLRLDSRCPGGRGSAAQSQYPGFHFTGTRRVYFLSYSGYRRLCKKIWDKLSPRTSQSMPGRMFSLSAEFQFYPGLLQRLSSICLPVEFSLTFLFDCVTLSIDAALVVSASEPFEVTPRYNSCATSFFIIEDRKGIWQFQLEKAACFPVDFLIGF